MAFYCKIEDSDRQLAADYWRITHQNCDYLTNIVDITLHGWASLDHRTQPKSQPLMVRSVRLELKDFQASKVGIFTYTLDQLYAMVLRKEKDGEFMGAKPI